MPATKGLPAVKPSPDHIYKVATLAAFAPAQRSGHFDGMGIDINDGYIHFSTAAQLPETLRLHFKGQQDLLLIAVTTAALGEALRWEPSRGGDLFPHLYDHLNTSAVAWTAPISVADDGSCELPEAVQ